MSQRTWFQHLLDDNNAIELRVSGRTRRMEVRHTTMTSMRSFGISAHFNAHGCNVYNSLNKPTHYVVTNRIHRQGTGTQKYRY